MDEMNENASINDDNNSDSDLEKIIKENETLNYKIMEKDKLISQYCKMIKEDEFNIENLKNQLVMKDEQVNSIECENKRLISEMKNKDNINKNLTEEISNLRFKLKEHDTINSNQQEILKKNLSSFRVICQIYL